MPAPLMHGCHARCCRPHVSFAMFQFARFCLACCGVALSMFSLQLCCVGWTLIPLVCGGYEPVCALAVSVFFGADIMASLGLSLLHRILLSWCHPLSFRCLWDVGLVFDA